MVAGYRRGEFEMKDIIKAIAWGFALLVVVIYTATMSYVPSMLLNETCWLTSKKVELLIPQVELLIPQVAEIADLKIKNVFDQFDAPNVYDQFDAPKVAQAAEDGDYKSRDEINRITYNACSGVRYSNNFAIHALRHTPKEQLKILKRLANDSSRIHEFNFYNWFRLFGGVMGVFAGAFLVYRLAKIQRYGVRSNIFVVLAIAPLLIIITSVLFYLHVGLDLNLYDSGKLEMAAICATLWIFLVYPVIFVTAKKHGGLKNLLFPKLH